MRKFNSILSLLVLLCLAPGLVSATTATTYIATTANYSDVKAKYDLCVNGDTISVPAGNVIWTTTLDLGTKAITIQGAGVGQTIITHNIAGSQVYAITFSQHASILTRITGITFLSGTYDRRFIAASGATSSTACRIDNCAFTGAGNCILLNFSGNAPVLVDHCAINAGLACEAIHNIGLGTGSGNDSNGFPQGWYDAHALGGADNVFIEDCTFTNTERSGNPAYYFGACVLQSYYGARTVFRHNAINGMAVDQHGTAGVVGARAFEIYENTWTFDNNAAQDNIIVIRGGTGVIFNNHKTGSNGAPGGISAYEENDSSHADPVTGNTVYRFAYQPGAGQDVNSNYGQGCALDPIYCWGNDVTPNGDGGAVQNGRDIYPSTTKPSYVAYTYPHPLQSGGADTTAPTPNPATISSALPTGTTTATVVANAATDDTSLGSSPYRFSSDNGSTWTAYQSSATYNWTGLTAATLYHMKVQYQDAAGNAGTASSASDITTDSSSALTIHTAAKLRGAF